MIKQQLNITSHSRLKLVNVASVLACSKGFQHD